MMSSERIPTRPIRDEMHSLDREIRRIEMVISQGDDEYEFPALPLACKRRRVIQSHFDEPPALVPEEQRQLLERSLHDLLAKRETLYRALRTAYRKNSKLHYK